MRMTTSPDSLTLHVPLRLVRRGGRKAVVLPQDTPAPRAHFDSTLVKALARAFRWKRMLDAGEVATIAELAERERIAPSHLSRVLRLTLLAPEIIEAILDGRQPRGLVLEMLREAFPPEWHQQTEWLRQQAR
ncbi:hypothetical protein [Rubellimicrobium roseum]